jgi:nucleoside-diphosphate-sugar epimerase
MPKLRVDFGPVRHRVFDQHRELPWSILQVRREPRRLTLSIPEDLLGRKLKKNFHPRRSGDVRKTMGDITAIKRDLKFRPQFKFEAGLKETFAYFSQKDRWKIDLG